MSLLDIIKSFCGGSSTTTTEHETAAPEAEAETEAPETEVAEAAPEVEAPAPEAAPVADVTTSKLQVPEDATLKRHFLSELTAEIEASMPEKPTDSSLKRHYDAAVQAKLDELLR